MKIKLFVISILCVLIFSALWMLRPSKKEVSLAQKVVEKGDPTFFTTISDVTFTSTLIPCITIEVEGKKHIVGFDLGADSPISLFKNHIEELSEKSFVRTGFTYGFRGNKHEKKIYQIPKIRIKDLTFYRPSLGEENESMARESSLNKKSEKLTSSIAGFVGWTLFNNYALFLDLENRSITICDSIETFKNRGYSLETFAHTSFKKDDFIEFEATTCNGPLLCILDTGCTFNILHFDNPNDQPIDQLVQDEEGFTTFSSFKIGEQDFGEVVFRPLPLRVPIPIEAILGMEFLIKHKVFIDFKNKQLYFCRNEN